MLSESGRSRENVCLLPGEREVSQWSTQYGWGNEEGKEKEAKPEERKQMKRIAWKQ